MPGPGRGFSRRFRFSSAAAAGGAVPAKAPRGSFRGGEGERDGNLSAVADHGELDRPAGLLALEHEPEVAAYLKKYPGASREELGRLLSRRS